MISGNLALVDKESMEARETLAIAKTLVITTDNDYNRAGELLRGIKTISRQIEEHYDPHIKRAYEQHKALVSDKKANLKPLEEAEAILKPKMADYHEEQERIRQEEQRRLAEEARKAEEIRCLEEAALLEQQGEVAFADHLIKEVLTAPAPLITLPKSAKADGISIKSVWSYEVVNEALIPREYLSIDHSKIGKIVTAMKAQTRIPGIKVIEQKQVSARRW